MSQPPRNELNNPCFARFYRRNRRTADKRGEREHRRRVLDGLYGRVVEIGEPRIAGGCHPTRDTEAAIQAAGFHIEHCDRFSFSPSLVSPEIPHRLGTARRT